MDPLTSALLAGLVIPLGAHPPEVPTPASVHFRLLSVKPGMSRRDVVAALGLRNEWGCPSGTALSLSTRYLVGTGHTLDIDYRYESEQKGFVLTQARLLKGRQPVASVPPPNPNAAPPFDPQVMEEVIRAIRQGSGTSMSGGFGSRQK